MKKKRETREILILTTDAIITSRDNVKESWPQARRWLKGFYWISEGELKDRDTNESKKGQKTLSIVQPSIWSVLKLFLNNILIRNT